MPADRPGVRSFGVEPGTGTVHYVLPQGEAWFANSSIDLWLQTLHHYGLHVSESEILSDPDDREDEALAELQHARWRTQEDRSTCLRRLQRVHLGRVPRPLALVVALGRHDPQAITRRVRRIEPESRGEQQQQDRTASCGCS
ncbi:hypothetical protein [Streptomyces sp. AC555_RSS877]|uniref:hypothetical protein n=1 Tax=Streptomyces sp. AC555_RSS877 TaxID=2823688 RepID=UPI0035ABF456